MENEAVHFLHESNLSLYSRHSLTMLTFGWMNNDHACQVSSSKGSRSDSLKSYQYRTHFQSPKRTLFPLSWIHAHACKSHSLHISLKSDPRKYFKINWQNENARFAYLPLMVENGNFDLVTLTHSIVTLTFHLFFIVRWTCVPNLRIIGLMVQTNRSVDTHRTKTSSTNTGGNCEIICLQPVICWTQVAK